MHHRARPHAAALLVAALGVACEDGRAETAPRPVPGADAGGEPAVPAVPTRFMAESDAYIRDTLATAPIKKVNKGRGGRTLAFKLTFDDGIQGYFKPEQTFASNWNSELAAYYLDRELGLGRVPPAVGRRISWKRLRPHAGRDPRLSEIVVRSETVRGSLVWWLPEKLVPLELPPDWPGWLRVDPSLTVSPFQSPTAYSLGKRRKTAPTKLNPPPPPVEDRPAELSDMIVFDYLIENLDRWGNENVNVQVLAGSKRLIYLDNANGFELRRKPSKLLEARLTAVQRFRKKTVSAIRALDVKQLAQRMAADPLAPLLSDEQLAALEVRRQRVLDHVDQIEKQYGAAAFPW